MADLRGTTAGSMAVSPGGPGVHAACDAEMVRLRHRLEAAEARLAAIAEHCRLRMNSPGRSGMSRQAARLILSIAGDDSETNGGAGYGRDFDGPVL